MYRFVQDHCLGITFIEPSDRQTEMFVKHQCPHGGGGGGNFHYKGIYRCAAGMGYTFQASQYMNGYHFYIKSISMGYLFHPKSI